MGAGRRGGLRRGPVVRGAPLLRLAGDEELPHARAGAALALPDLPGVPGLPRRTAQARGAAVAGGQPHRGQARARAHARAPPARGDARRTRLRRPAGAVHPRRDAPAARPLPGVLRPAAPARPPRRGHRAAARRDPRPPRLPRRGRPGLPHPGPPVAHPLRRRGPAHQPDHRAGHLAGEHPVRARRAEHRAARARRGPHRLGAAQAAGGGQHPAGGGARHADHARGGPDHRPGSGSRRAGRRGGVPGHPAGAAALAALAHRGVAARGAADRAAGGGYFEAGEGFGAGGFGVEVGNPCFHASGPRPHRDPGRVRPQPRGHRRRRPAAPLRMRERGQRLGEVHAGGGRALPRRVQAARAGHRGPRRAPGDRRARRARRRRARGPVAHRQDHPLEPRELRRGARRGPQAVRGRAGGDRARVYGGDVQLQLRQRALPGLWWKRLRARGDAVPERRVPALPRLRRATLSKRSARREDPPAARGRRGHPRSRGRSGRSHARRQGRRRKRGGHPRSRRRSGGSQARRGGGRRER